MPFYLAASIKFIIAFNNITLRHEKCFAKQELAPANNKATQENRDESDNVWQRGQKLSPWEFNKVTIQEIRETRGQANYT